MLGTSKGDKGVLVYGLGDEGYGIVHLDEDFRMYETQTGSEKYRKAVAKTNIIGMSAREGFLWKLGGYTAITGGYTRKSQGRKKTPCFLQAFAQTKSNTGFFKQMNSLSKMCNLLGEIEKDVFLIYSYTDHSFATWNASTNEFLRVNLVSARKQKPNRGS